MPRPRRGSSARIRALFSAFKCAMARDARGTTLIASNRKDEAASKALVTNGAPAARCKK